MPLPPTTLSLGPFTNPGETQPTKPRPAMLLRLSSAAIDAIIANQEAQLDFESGQSPGFHIAGTFFPMRMQKETTPHEIYLRTQQKNNGPETLKLYANVSEKLYIEHSEIGDDLKDRIREKTLEAAKQRDDRRTKFIDTPPPLPSRTTGKEKKKPVTMFRNALRPSDKFSEATSSSARISSPAPLQSQIKRKGPQDPALRGRLVHFIAIHAEKTRDEIIKSVSGGDASARSDISDLLEQVAESTTPFKKGEEKTWHLKPKSWLEVRPFEWPKLADTVRSHLSRTGRINLSKMGYKETDPEWRFFIPPDTGSSASPAGPSRKAINATAGEAQQRSKPDIPIKAGISSKEARKPKPQHSPDTDIQMKDESAKANRVSSSSVKAREVTASTPTPATSARKLPGSGFQATKPSTQVRNEIPAVRDRAMDTKPSRPSLPPKPAVAPQAPPKDNKSNAAASRIQKIRDSDGHGSDSERPKPMAKRQEVAEVSALKRKHAPSNLSNPDTSNLPPPQKKRKAEDGVAASVTSTKDPRSRDTSLPKKPDAPAQKAPNDASPQPLALPKINKKANPYNITTQERKPSPLQSTSSAHTSQEFEGESKSTGKRRRPVYTSSEDESDSPKKRSNPTLNTHPRQRGRERDREPSPKPLPTDHAGLRMRYAATYGECLTAQELLKAQKKLIDTMLRHEDTGSDEDGQLMDFEELAKLSSRYARLYEELEMIRKRFPEPVV
ncbi:hypothetical protein H0H92_008871 [Tricholoma furcatifolium]|nr:hypothetical protein H0H92_008871 [Tricholoma furcatifolium]